MSTQAYLVRLPDALRLTGLRRTAFLDKVRKGEIPSPVKLSARSVAWRIEDLHRWCESLPAARRSA